MVEWRELSLEVTMVGAPSSHPTTSGSSPSYTTRAIQLVSSTQSQSHFNSEELQQKAQDQFLKTLLSQNNSENMFSSNSQYEDPLEQEAKKNRTKQNTRFTLPNLILRPFDTLYELLKDARVSQSDNEITEIDLIHVLEFCKGEKWQLHNKLKCRLIGLRIFYYLAKKECPLSDDIISELTNTWREADDKSLPYIAMTLGYTILLRTEAVLEFTNIPPLLTEIQEKLEEVNLPKHLEPIIILMAAKTKLGLSLTEKDLSILNEVLESKFFTPTSFSHQLPLNPPPIPTWILSRSWLSKLYRSLMSDKHYLDDKTFVTVLKMYSNAGSEEQVRYQILKIIELNASNHPNFKTTYSQVEELIAVLRPALTESEYKLRRLALSIAIRLESKGLREEILAASEEQHLQALTALNNHVKWNQTTTSTQLQQSLLTSGLVETIKSRQQELSKSVSKMIKEIGRMQVITSHILACCCENEPISLETLSFSPERALESTNICLEYKDCLDLSTIKKVSKIITSPNGGNAQSESKTNEIRKIEFNAIEICRYFAERKQEIVPEVVFGAIAKICSSTDREIVKAKLQLLTACLPKCIDMLNNQDLINKLRERLEDSFFRKVVLSFICKWIHYLKEKNPSRLNSFEPIVITIIDLLSPTVITQQEQLDMITTLTQFAKIGYIFDDNQLSRLSTIAYSTENFNIHFLFVELFKSYLKNIQKISWVEPLFQFLLNYAETQNEFRTIQSYLDLLDTPPPLSYDFLEKLKSRVDPSEMIAMLDSLPLGNDFNLAFNKFLDDIIFEKQDAPIETENMRFISVIKKASISVENWEKIIKAIHPLTKNKFLRIILAICKYKISALRHLDQLELTTQAFSSLLDIASVKSIPTSIRLEAIILLLELFEDIDDRYFSLQTLITLIEDYDEQIRNSSILLLKRKYDRLQTPPQGNQQDELQRIIAPLITHPLTQRSALQILIKMSQFGHSFNEHVYRQTIQAAYYCTDIETCRLIIILLEMRQGVSEDLNSKIELALRMLDALDRALNLNHTTTHDSFTHIINVIERMPPHLEYFISERTLIAIRDAICNVLIQSDANPDSQYQLSAGIIDLCHRNSFPPLPFLTALIDLLCLLNLKDNNRLIYERDCLLANYFLQSPINHEGALKIFQERINSRFSEITHLESDIKLFGRVILIAFELEFDLEIDQCTLLSIICIFIKLPIISKSKEQIIRNLIDILITPKISSKLEENQIEKAERSLISLFEYVKEVDSIEIQYAFCKLAGKFEINTETFEEWIDIKERENHFLKSVDLGNLTWDGKDSVLFSQNSTPLSIEFFYIVKQCLAKITPDNEKYLMFVTFLPRFAKIQQLPLFIFDQLLKLSPIFYPHILPVIESCVEQSHPLEDDVVHFINDLSCKGDPLASSLLKKIIRYQPEHERIIHFNPWVKDFFANNIETLSRDLTTKDLYELFLLIESDTAQNSTILELKELITHFKQESQIDSLASEIKRYFLRKAVIKLSTNLSIDPEVRNLILYSTLSLCQYGWNFRKLYHWIRQFELNNEKGFDEFTNLICFINDYREHLDERQIYDNPDPNLESTIVLSSLHEMIVRNYLASVKSIKDKSALIQSFSLKMNERHTLHHYLDRIDALYLKPRQCDPKKKETAIQEWSKEDIKLWSLSFKKEHSSLLSQKEIAYPTCSSTVFLEHTRSEHNENVADPLCLLIAIMRRACKLIYGYEPRLVQQLAVITLTHNKSLGQVLTGEGKSLIIAMLTIIKCFEGKTVDIMTTTSQLASEGVRNYQPLYELFGLKAASNYQEIFTEELKECYKEVDIIYGDPYTFRHDAMMNQKNVLGTRGKRLFGVILIDEADNIIIEGSNTNAVIGNRMPGMDELTSFLILIWTEVCRLQSDPADQMTKEEGISRLEDYLHQVENQVGAMLTPKHLQKYVDLHKRKWIENAWLAYNEFEIDIHYKLKEGEDYSSKIVPVDYANTGMVQTGTTWSDGLHQFLQMKNHLPIDPLNLETNYSSIQSYIKKYDERIGITGTLGSPSLREFMFNIYEFETREIPSFADKNVIQLSTSIFDTSNEWMNFIVNGVNRESGLGRVVLIICETIEDTKKLEKLLTKPGCHPPLTYNDDKDSSNDFLQREHGSGTVIIGTNLAGRGIDISMTKEVRKKGGLHVCLTYFPCNDRVELQAYGRAGRRGEPGTFQLVLNRENLSKQFTHSQLSSQSNALDLNLLKNLREESEKRTIDVLRENLREDDVKDLLLNAYHSLYKQILEKLKQDLVDRFISSSKKFFDPEVASLQVFNTFQIKALEEYWGLWITQIHQDTNKMKQLKEHIANYSENHPCPIDDIPYFSVEFKDKIVEHFLDDHGNNLFKNKIEKGLINPNPFYYMQIGNSLLEMANSMKYAVIKEELLENACKAYHKAIECDRLFSLQAYYHRALAFLQMKKSLTGERKLVNEAKKNLEELIEILQSQIRHLKSIPLNMNEKSNKLHLEILVSHIATKINLFSVYLTSSFKNIQSIEELQKRISIDPYFSFFEEKNKKKHKGEGAVRKLKNANLQNITLSLHDLKTYIDCWSSSELLQTIETLSENKAVSSNESTLSEINGRIIFTFDSEKLSSQRSQDEGIQSLLPINRFKLKKFAEIHDFAKKKLLTSNITVSSSSDPLPSSSLDPPLLNSPSSSNTPYHVEPLEESSILTIEDLPYAIKNSLKSLKRECSTRLSLLTNEITSLKPVEKVIKGYRRTSEKLESGGKKLRKGVVDFFWKYKNITKLKPTVIFDRLSIEDIATIFSQFESSIEEIKQLKSKPKNSSPEDAIQEINQIGLNPNSDQNEEADTIENQQFGIGPFILTEELSEHLRTEHPELEVNFIRDFTIIETKKIKAKELTVVSTAQHPIQVSISTCSLDVIKSLLALDHVLSSKSLKLSIIFHQLKQNVVNHILNKLSYRTRLVFTNLTTEEAEILASMTEKEQNNATVSFENISTKTAQQIIRHAERVLQEVTVNPTPFKELAEKQPSLIPIVPLLESQGYLYLFEAAEKVPIPLKSVALLLGINLSQILGGLSLATFTAGFGALVGKSCIVDGIFDLVKIYQVIKNRQFNALDYCTGKLYKMAFILATAGIASHAKHADHVRQATNSSKGVVSKQKHIKKLVESAKMSGVKCAKKTTQSFFGELMKSTGSQIIQHIQPTSLRTIVSHLEQMFESKDWDSNLWRILNFDDRNNSNLQFIELKVRATKMISTAAQRDRGLNIWSQEGLNQFKNNFEQFLKDKISQQNSFQQEATSSNHYRQRSSDYFRMKKNLIQHISGLLFNQYKQSLNQTFDIAQLFLQKGFNVSLHYAFEGWTNQIKEHELDDSDSDQEQNPSSPISSVTDQNVDSSDDGENSKSANDAVNILGAMPSKGSDSLASKDDDAQEMTSEPEPKESPDPPSYLDNDLPNLDQPIAERSAPSSSWDEEVSHKDFIAAVVLSATLEPIQTATILELQQKTIAKYVIQLCEIKEEALGTIDDFNPLIQGMIDNQLKIIHSLVGTFIIRQRIIRDEPNYTGEEFKCKIEEITTVLLTGSIDSIPLMNDMASTPDHNLGVLRTQIEVSVMKYRKLKEHKKELFDKILNEIASDERPSDIRPINTVSSFLLVDEGFWGGVLLQQVGAFAEGLIKTEGVKIQEKTRIKLMSMKLLQCALEQHSAINMELSSMMLQHACKTQIASESFAEIARVICNHYKDFLNKLLHEASNDKISLDSIMEEFEEKRISSDQLADQYKDFLLENAIDMQFFHDCLKAAADSIEKFMNNVIKTIPNQYMYKTVKD